MLHEQQTNISQLQKKKKVYDLQMTFALISLIAALDVKLTGLG